MHPWRSRMRFIRLDGADAREFARVAAGLSRASRGSGWCRTCRADWSAPTVISGLRGTGSSMFAGRCSFEPTACVTCRSPGDPLHRGRSRWWSDGLHRTNQPRLEAVVVATLGKNRPELASVLGACGQLFTTGVPVDWPAVFAGLGGRRVELPTYAFSGGASGDAGRRWTPPMRPVWVWAD